MGSSAHGAAPLRSEAFAAGMLTLACLCWAAFFSLTKNWQEAATRCPGKDSFRMDRMTGHRGDAATDIGWANAFP